MSEWTEHSISYMRENGITLKEALQDHSNAAGYYSKKAKKMKDTPYISELKQEICKDIHSLNEVNKKNSKGSLEYSINDAKLKKNRDFIKKVLSVEEKPVKEKAPKPVKEKTPKPVKEKAPKK